MQLLLVNHKNAQDIAAFSGTPHFMRRALRQEFEDLAEYDLHEPPDLPDRLRTATLRECLGPAGRQLSAQIDKGKFKPDFILCQGGNMAVPFYQHSTPLVYWHDSTWHTYLHGYGDSQRFGGFKSNYPVLCEWDQRALQQATLIVFSSEYVAEACIADYGIAREKIKVIPFGANIYEAPPLDIVETALHKRKDNPVVQLTFLGKDWKRKGLEDAYRLALRLNEMGVETRLNTIGCDPSLNDTIRSPFVKMFGFINKQRRTDLDLFEEVLQYTHFLVHPALSEPYGIALCEANAFGIPVIGTDVEGLKTIVRNGRNGYLLNKIDFSASAADLIRSILGDFANNYAPLCRSSRYEYDTRLNWNSAVRSLKQLLYEMHATPNTSTHSS